MKQWEVDAVSLIFAVNITRSNEIFYSAYSSSKSVLLLINKEPTNTACESWPQLFPKEIHTTQGNIKLLPLTFWTIIMSDKEKKHIFILLRKKWGKKGKILAEFTHINCYEFHSIRMLNNVKGFFKTLVRSASKGNFRGISLA